MALKQLRHCALKMSLSKILALLILFVWLSSPTSALVVCDPCAGPGTEERRQELKLQLKELQYFADSPVRVVVRVCSPSDLKVVLSKGPQDREKRRRIEKKLDLIKEQLKGSLKEDERFTLEFCVIKDGKVLERDDPENPFALKRKRLKEAEKHFAPEHAISDENLYRQYLEEIVALAFDCSDRLMDDEAITRAHQLLRYYNFKKDYARSLALAKMFKEIDRTTYFSESVDIADQMGDGAAYEKLMKGQIQNFEDRGEFDSASGTLIQLGNFFYKKNLLKEAQNCYEKASRLATTDTKLKADYTFACFLASTDRLKEAAPIMRACLAEIDGLRKNGNPICRQIPEDFGTTFLALVQNKNRGLYEELLPSINSPMEKYGILDKSGRELTEAQFLEIKDFSDGLAPAKDWLTNRYGYIDRKGNWKIPPRFKIAYPFDQGLASVLPADSLFPLDFHQNPNTESFSIIKTDGSLYRKTPYLHLIPCGEGIFQVYGAHFNGASDLIDKDGKVLYSNVLEGLAKFENDSAEVFVVTGCQWSGCEVWPLGYSERLHLLRQGSRLSTIEHTKCKPTPEPQAPSPKEVKADAVRPLSQGRAAFCKDLKWGFLDEEGRVVIPARYISVGSFHEGLTSYCK